MQLLKFVSLALIGLLLALVFRLPADAEPEIDRPASSTRSAEH